MSTRSDIIVQLSSGTWKRIYCHSDGYLEHNGQMLAQHYNTQALADVVVAPGDLSFLDARIDRPEGHSFASRAPGCSVYYARDRGEQDALGHTAATLSEVWPEADCWTEFTYVWSRDLGIPAGAWYVGDPDEGSQTLVLLALALAGVGAPKTAIKAPWGVIGHR